MSESNPGSILVRHRSLFLFLLGLLLLVPWLGMRDLWYPDEPDIAEVSQSMYVSGDWVAPRRMGVIWVDYPPMIYWAGTASAHLLGGMSEFALRLPNALTAICLVLLTCWVASRWFDSRTGLWAGFLLLTFQQFVYEAINYRPDTLFSFMIAAGMFLYARGVGESQRGLLRVGAFVLFGLAMLAKGPLGLLLPGLVLTLWHGSRREWRRLFELAPLALISFAVYLPWFVACAHAMGSDNILYELYAQNFARFFSGSRGHGQPVYYYLVQIWIDLLPWGPLLPFAIWWTVRTDRYKQPNTQLMLWWFGTFLVFLSMAVTKRQLYMLPAYPAAAMLLAPWIAKLTRRGSLAPDAPSSRPVRIYVPILIAVLAIIAVAFVVVAVVFEPIVAQMKLNPMRMEAARAERLPMLVTALILLAGGYWLFRAWQRGDVRSMLVRLGVLQIPLWLAVMIGILPALNPAKTYKPACQWIRQQIGSETHFGLVYPEYAMRKMGAFGFYTGALVDRMEHQVEVESYLRDHPTSVVLVHESSTDEIFAGDEPKWKERVVRELRTGRDRYLVITGP
ncbi:MAG: glycosyltransferase family 39 protein [Thermoanaerobaculia bacterium]|jgi:4-amino-4-deoxy-L-arabinose transferase-like glycosyltransferase